MANQKGPAKLDFTEKFQEKILRLAYQEEAFAGAIVDNLRPEQFENPMHSWFWKEIRHSHKVFGSHITPTMLNQERKKACDAGIIRPEHHKAYKRFAALKLGLPVPDRTYIKQEVQNFIQHQAVKRFVLDAAEELLPNHKYEDIRKRMLDIVDIDVLNAYGGVALSPADSIEKRIKLREKLAGIGITTGLPELDKLMRAGGLQPKQLGCIIAPTGRGKTNWLINLAASAVLDDVPTVYYSLELDTDSINERFDARFTGIDLRLLRHNPDQVRREWKKYRDIVRRNLRVKEFPTGTPTVSTIRQDIRQLERHAFYPKLVIIDYADLMRPRTEFADSAYESQGLIYTELRGLMMELGVAGWTATQGNRASMDPEKNESGDVELFHMADSIKKAFVCDVVGGLAQSKKEKKAFRGRFALLKNRNGSSGREIPIYIDHDKVVFKGVH